MNFQGEFREDQFLKAMSFVNDVDQGRSREARNQAMQQTTSNVTLLVRTIRERDLLPCIVFSFSRKECEAYAAGLKDMDFNDSKLL
jgi:ATP-dependent RNA helicase DOB1